MDVGRGSKAKFSVSTGETWQLANPLSLLPLSNSLPLCPDCPHSARWKALPPLTSSKLLH